MQKRARLPLKLAESTLMTKSESQWLEFLRSVGDTENILHLILVMNSIERPDADDLAFLRKIVNKEVDHGDDIVVPAVAVMATYFPESVDIQIEDPEKMEEMLLEHLKGLGL